MAMLKSGVLQKIVQNGAAAAATAAAPSAATTKASHGASSEGNGGGPGKTSTPSTIVLQVLAITPALPGDDSFMSRTFFLKVSDSLHCMYAMLAQEEADLILSDRLQLGKLLEIRHFQPHPSVPVLRGVRPLPGRFPCFGRPEELGPPLEDVIAAAAELGYGHRTDDCCDVDLPTPSLWTEGTFLGNLQARWHHQEPVRRSSGARMALLASMESPHGSRSSSIASSSPPSTPPRTPCGTMASTLNDLSPVLVGAKRMHVPCPEERQVPYRGVNGNDSPVEDVVSNTCPADDSERDDLITVADICIEEDCRKEFACGSPLQSRPESVLDCHEGGRYLSTYGTSTSEELQRQKPRSSAKVSPGLMRVSTDSPAFSPFKDAESLPKSQLGSSKVRDRRRVASFGGDELVDTQWLQKTTDSRGLFRSCTPVHNRRRMSDGDFRVSKLKIDEVASLPIRTSLELGNLKKSQSFGQSRPLSPLSTASMTNLGSRQTGAVTPKGMDVNIRWENLPPNLVALGQDVLQRRDEAVGAATTALEEAAAANSVLDALGKYAGLRSSASLEPLQHGVEDFLRLHQELVHVSAMALATASTLQSNFPSTPKMGDKGLTSPSRLPFSMSLSPRGQPSGNVAANPNTNMVRASERNRKAAAWVTAALASDLNPLPGMNFSTLGDPDKQGRRQSGNMASTKVFTPSADRKVKSMAPCVLVSGPQLFSEQEGGDKEGSGRRNSFGGRRDPKGRPLQELTTLLEPLSRRCSGAVTTTLAPARTPKSSSRSSISSMGGSKGGGGDRRAGGRIMSNEGVGSGTMASPCSTPMQSPRISLTPEKERLAVHRDSPTDGLDETVRVRMNGGMKECVQASSTSGGSPHHVFRMGGGGEDSSARGWESKGAGHEHAIDGDDKEQDDAKAPWEWEAEGNSALGWVAGKGCVETVECALELQRDAQEWFFSRVEAALDEGERSPSTPERAERGRRGGVDGVTLGRTQPCTGLRDRRNGSRLADVFSILCRLNEWLATSDEWSNEGGKVDSSSVLRLKKRIRDFVLHHAVGAKGGAMSLRL
ncbi:hypothetical protein CBR_g49456 [Chara braunii]|uniref:Uncharacterized protein n=1 Tax=Chara braunii TaxID=69332 RepID=A0A388K570_CHABU|nr:hypothetical protein CBR_g49456 [Chara braunii]|eukprot:GBG65093.1 hypothetical protein CBR_g49456 [Chara braunii]